ncbi:hypothetical protein HDU83_009573 [Entophlyctis luteolus]|nr:hypothetical protein HDU83_009573 [Entophlyctis luteolus]
MDAQDIGGFVPTEAGGDGIDSFPGNIVWGLGEWQGGPEESVSSRERSVPDDLLGDDGNEVVGENGVVASVTGIEATLGAGARVDGAGSAGTKLATESMGLFAVAYASSTAVVDSH